MHDLRRCTTPHTRPHGRPTMIEMDFRELEKKFKRSQCGREWQRGNLLTNPNAAAFPCLNA